MNWRSDSTLQAKREAILRIVPIHLHRSHAPEDRCVQCHGTIMAGGHAMTPMWPLVVICALMPILLLLGCGEDTVAGDRHASVEPCSIQAVAMSPGGHVAVPPGDGAVVAGAPTAPPPGPLRDRLTAHEIRVDCLWNVCVPSSRAPPLSRSV